MLIYNIGIFFLGLILRLAALFKPKAKLWVDGRKDWLPRLKQAIDSSRQVVWVHAASLGEFEQGRPVIEKIKADYPNCFLLLTFFSPSGYESKKDYAVADHVCYLPLDTVRNARRFARVVRPSVAIFVKYEFWINMLTAVQRRGCRLFVCSSIFRENSVFFRPYGYIFRRLLLKFERIFVQDRASLTRLSKIGIHNVEQAGDTRFDRVKSIAKHVKALPLVESFASGSSVMVCGSTWGADEALIERLITDNADVKFIIAPHEIDRKRINALIERLNVSCARYTKCAKGEDLSSCRVLFIDTIGILSSVYAYGHWAYIGGGFGVGIHNTLEAATFALPLSFGPNYLKFAEACDMVKLGVAVSVSDYTSLSEWFSKVKHKDAYDAAIRESLKSYVDNNLGATKIIVRRIFGN